MIKPTYKIGVLSVIILLVIGGIQASGPALAQVATPAVTSAPLDVTFPDLSGPYKVGRTSYEWIDQSRPETFASAPGLKRDLVVYIWFPASVTKRTKIAPYMDGGLMWDIWSGRSGREGPTFVRTTSPHAGLENLVHTHAYSSSLVDTDKPSYPVIIFVPSIHGTALNYASIVEDIASHGYIVIGTNIPFTSSVVSYPDGRLVVSGVNQQVIGDPNPVANPLLLAILTKDIQFVLDQAENLNATDESFKGHLDLKHVGVLGHHQGGQISISAITTDPRITAGAALEAATTADPENKPFLFVGSGFGTASRPAQLTQDQHGLLVDGMIVGNYGDFAFLVPIIPEINPPPPNPNAILGGIDPARGAQIVNSYLVAFFDHYLKGADLKWPTYPEAHLATFGVAAATSASGG